MLLYYNRDEKNTTTLLHFYTDGNLSCIFFSVCLDKVRILQKKLEKCY